MKQPLPFPTRLALAFIVTAGILLAIPSVAHLVLGGPNETPLAWSAPSLLATTVASVAGVAFLAWRRPSGWATLLAALVTAVMITIVPLAVFWKWWQILVVYLVYFGVYLATVPALLAAAAVLHGRDGLRFRRAAPTATRAEYA